MKVSGSRRRVGSIGGIFLLLLSGCNSTASPPAPLVPVSLSEVAEAKDVVQPTTNANVPFTSITQGLPDEAHLLTGIGGTLSKPLYDYWFAAYNRQIGVKVDYQGKGSGAGIRAISLGQVDFAGSGAPMTDAEMQKAKGGKIVHIPTAFGAVVLAYNVPGVSGRLRFSPQNLADIYQGEITRWNDPRLVANNASLASVKADIITLHRGDGSGTTYAFSDYLSTVSPAWQKRVGKGTSIYWPVGMGVNKNDGMVRGIKQNPYSIGFTELNYALPNKLAYASIQNRGGQFVEPSLASISAAVAASGANALGDLRFSIVNAPGPAVYPLCTGTWLLAYQNMTNAAKAEALTRFLWWAIHDGQAVNTSLNFAPVPQEMRVRSEALIRQIRVNGRTAFVSP